MLQAVFYNRDFSRRAVQPAGLAVRSARWEAVGGPAEAELEAQPGCRLGLAELINLLRCPVELVEAGGGAAWWGYVDGFERINGRLGLKCTLQDMGNKVKVLFKDSEARTDQKALWSETGWADDLASQALYGEKQSVIRRPAGTHADAEGLQDVLLEVNAWPVAAPFVDGSNRSRTTVRFADGGRPLAGGCTTSPWAWLSTILIQTDLRTWGMTGAPRDGAKFHGRRGRLGFWRGVAADPGSGRAWGYFAG